MAKIRQSSGLAVIQELSVEPSLFLAFILLTASNNWPTVKLRTVGYGERENKEINSARERPQPSELNKYSFGWR